MFVSKIYEKQLTEKNKKDDTACPQLATSMYAALTRVKIYKIKNELCRLSYRGVLKGTKNALDLITGIYKCPRSNRYFQRRELTPEKWQAKQKKGDNQASHKTNKIILDRYEIVPLSLTAPDSVEGRTQNNLIRTTDQYSIVP